MTKKVSFYDENSRKQFEATIEAFERLAKETGSVSKAMIVLGRAFAYGLNVGIVGKHGYMSLDEWLIMKYGIPPIEPSGVLSSKLAAGLLLLAMLAALALAGAMM